MTESIETFDNKELLKQICDFYGYTIEYLPDDYVYISDMYFEANEYRSVELALIDWLDTLLESEDYRILHDIEMESWEPAIKYIEELKNKQ